ncbi:MAG: SprT-like domain-containing protein [Congregibacter sp.]
MDLEPLSSLSKNEIERIVGEELQRALSLFPNWVHPFSSLEFNNSRRTFGQAHQDGKVVLSNSFIGTCASEDLVDTVRHEFAHLIVGIRQKHNVRWRMAAASLGARPKATGRSKAEDLHERMTDAPFTLIAVMLNGDERVMRQVFRRSKRYLDYCYERGGDRYHIDGEFIARFRYEDNRP